MSREPQLIPNGLCYLLCSTIILGTLQIQLKKQA